MDNLLISDLQTLDKAVIESNLKFEFTGKGCVSKLVMLERENHVLTEYVNDIRKMYNDLKLMYRNILQPNQSETPT